MRTFITLTGLIAGCGSAEVIVQGEPQQPMLSAFWYQDGPPEQEAVQWVATSTPGGCAHRARWYRGAAAATIQFNEDGDRDAYAAALLDLQPDDFWSFHAAIFSASPTDKSGAYASSEDADFSLVRRTGGGEMEMLSGSGSLTIQEDDGALLRGQSEIQLRDDQQTLAGTLSITAGATRCRAAEEGAAEFAAANGL